MDIETPVTATEQLPQIRRISRLEDVRRVVPPKPVVPPRKEIKPPQKPRLSLRFFIIGLLFFGILGVEWAIIYKYDKLNKRLLQVSTILKNRVVVLQNRLQYANKINNKIIASRSRLINNYFNLASQYKTLQFKMDDYRDISLAKLSKIDMLGGNLRVAYAQIEAVKVQNEVLARELGEKAEYIRELTAKLINSIGEQEFLVNENLQLKKEIETLKRYTEVKDVNQ